MQSSNGARVHTEKVSCRDRNRVDGDQALSVARDEVSILRFVTKSGLSLCV